MIINFKKEKNKGFMLNIDFPLEQLPYLLLGL